MAGQLCKEEECTTKAAATIKLLRRWNKLLTDKERALVIDLSEKVIGEGQAIVARVRDRTDGTPDTL